MKRNLSLGCAGVLVLIAGIILGFRAHSARADESALQTQLRLARSAGLPTNAAELEATIPTAADAENAAPFYREMSGGHFPGASTFDLGSNAAKADTRLLRNASAGNLAAARKVLQAGKAQLDLLDQATKKPRCWFNRDWSQGAAVLFPELAYMKVGARLLALRGTVAATQGDTAGALAAAQEIFVEARHGRQMALHLAP